MLVGVFSLPCTAAAQVPQFFSTSPAVFNWIYPTGGVVADFDRDGSSDLCVSGWIGSPLTLFRSRTPLPRPARVRHVDAEVLGQSTDVLAHAHARVVQVDHGAPQVARVRSISSSSGTTFGAHFASGRRVIRSMRSSSAPATNQSRSFDHGGGRPPK